MATSDQGTDHGTGDGSGGGAPTPPERGIDPSTGMRHDPAEDQAGQASVDIDVEESAAAGPAGQKPMPLDLISPQLTIRALLTGMIFGSVLSICNVYLGLKIGWGTNMSITGILLGFAFWKALQGILGARAGRFTMLENNINQSACSAAAAVSSAGLVAPIPALTMLTGETLAYPLLAIWVFAVCLVGITAATGLRRQMVVVDKLPFPSGIACAETLREIYGRGSEALRRVALLGSAALVAGVVKVLELSKVLVAVGLPFKLKGVEAAAMGFRLEPSLLMVGVGGIIGFRAAASLLIGAIIAWGILGPQVIDSGAAEVTSRQSLARLPVGVELMPGGRLQHRGSQGTLTFRGVMTDSDRDGYLALSDEPMWIEAIDRLHLLSNRDGERLSALAAERAFTTTAELQRSIEVPHAGRAPVPPSRWIGFLTVERLAADDGAPEALRISVLGAPPAALLEDLAERASEAEPSERERALVLRDAVAAMAALPAPEPTIPEALADRLRWNAQLQALVASGPLSEEDQSALAAATAALPRAPDFAATAKRLRTASDPRMTQLNFADTRDWLIWPGVTLMVVASLVSFAFSWRSMLRAFTGSKDPAAELDGGAAGDLPRAWFLGGIIVALVISVWLQMSLFAIVWWAATLGVLLSFVLAIVGSRVSGETNITPVGAMGKVTQLLFGVLLPKSAAANLMAANVTGGAASQCADLMHDFKCGWLLGASPRRQFVAQIAGAFAGSLVGSAFYLILIPNPAEMLLTPEWPAPAVAAWKAVAELFLLGIDQLPQSSRMAMLWAAIFGVLLPVAERFFSKRFRVWVPSAASVGLAFVVGAEYAISMFIGGTIALFLSWLFPKWSARFIVTICAGIIVGDSLVGAGDAIRKLFESLG
ncbi:MAG TPA: OPT family oligopeptide transporter [Phycisphaerales bacterium]|nr:OPT family oligopeptide transporter [Phycisphaerales bacterium]HMP36369.1 OPT family oligopeptide transporter [Phycisphaerales bacterium]